MPQVRRSPTLAERPPVRIHRHCTYACQGSYFPRRYIVPVPYAGVTCNTRYEQPTPEAVYAPRSFRQAGRCGNSRCLHMRCLRCLPKTLAPSMPKGKTAQTTPKRHMARCLPVLQTGHTLLNTYPSTSTTQDTPNIVDTPLPWHGLCTTRVWCGDVCDTCLTPIPPRDVHHRERPRSAADPLDRPPRCAHTICTPAMLARGGALGVTRWQ